MTPHDAIAQACAAVGIKPPRSYRHGQWTKTDTLSGKNGKGDGRIIVDDLKATAWNHQTGEHETVWLKDRASLTPVERKEYAEKKRRDEAEARRRADEAASVAARLVNAARSGSHPYLVAKGFPAETMLTIAASTVAEIAGDYMVCGSSAIVIPAKIGARVTSVQLIWEDGSKKFLAGGVMGGATHRIATGRETWLCEGYATGLSLRAALKAMSRSATVLVCFSAHNMTEIARATDGPCFIAADHDKVPLADPFDGLGTGEHYARLSGRPYMMPEKLGQDFNDVHVSEGLFAVQRYVKELVRRS